MTRNARPTSQTCPGLELVFSSYSSVVDSTPFEKGKTTDPLTFVDEITHNLLPA